MIKYITQQRARYWPVSKKLMAHYNDGSHSNVNDFGLYWYQNGLAHRDSDKPACISPKGTLVWYQNGIIHRDGDLPAYIGADGRLEWWQNNQLHRICGPARIWPDGYLEWWINYKNITEEVNLWLNRKRWRSTQEQIFEFQLRFV